MDEYVTLNHGVGEFESPPEHKCLFRLVGFKAFALQAKDHPFESDKRYIQSHR